MLANRLLKVIGLGVMVLSLLGVGRVSAQVNDLINNHNPNPEMDHSLER